MIQRGEERPTEFVAVSTLPHVILHEGLARSCRIHCRNFLENNLLPGEKMPLRADEGWESANGDSLPFQNDRGGEACCEE